MTQFAAALFDLDGTLVDTMPLHHEAYRRVFARFGFELSFDAYMGAIGGPAREAIPRMLAGREAPVAVGDIHRMKLDEAARIFEAERPLALPCASLLDVLKPHYRLGLVSSGARAGVERIVARMGWQDMFEVVVSGDEVVRGKPDPEPYLRAAEMLSLAPALCIAFEDTEAGIVSARSAGMTAIDVRP